MLTSSIQNPDNALLGQFPNELLYKGPALVICNRAHQDYQNLQAYELMRNNCLSRDKNRYPRSIDIESELYRINFYRDRCFYDNYKLDPRTMPIDNDLYRSRKALVHDYSYYQNHQDTVWQAPRPLSTTPGGIAKPLAEKFEDMAWNLTAQREAVANYANLPNYATMNQCDSFHAYQRSGDYGGVSDTSNAACGIGMTDEGIIRSGMVAQVGPLVPGIRAHKVEQGGWKSADTRMKQLADGVLKQQLDTDWSKFKIVAKDGNCVQQFEHFPGAPTPFPDEKHRPGEYYNKPDGEPDRIGGAGLEKVTPSLNVGCLKHPDRHLRESEALAADTGINSVVRPAKAGFVCRGCAPAIRQVFPIDPKAEFYDFQKNCPQFQPERLFYNISKNRMTPNTLNYVNYNNAWNGENLKPK